MRERERDEVHVSSHAKLFDERSSVNRFTNTVINQNIWKSALFYTNTYAGAYAGGDTGEGGFQSKELMQSQVTGS
jgi:hypothetical protein